MPNRGARRARTVENSRSSACMLRFFARIGIATGTVVVSELLINKAPGEQAVIGETPDPARLRALANPGR